MREKYQEDTFLKETHPEWYDEKGNYINLKLSDLKDEATIRLFGEIIKQSLKDYTRKIKSREKHLEVLNDPKRSLKFKKNTNITRNEHLKEKHEAYLFFKSKLFSLSGLDCLYLIRHFSNGRIKELKDVDDSEYVFIDEKGNISFLTDE